MVIWPFSTWPSEAVWVSSSDGPSGQSGCTRRSLYLFCILAWSGNERTLSRAGLRSMLDFTIHWRRGHQLLSLQCVAHIFANPMHNRTLCHYTWSLQPSQHQETLSENLFQTKFSNWWSPSINWTLRIAASSSSWCRSLLNLAQGHWCLSMHSRQAKQLHLEDDSHL